MPSGGVIAICALAAIGYLYIGRPVAHEAKKVALKTKHAIVHVVTLGKK